MGIILLFFIGRAFYRLAGTHGFHQWGYAILSIAVYYGFQFFLGAVPIIVWGIFDPAGADAFLVELVERELLYNLLGILLAGGAVAGLYYFLKNRWENRAKSVLEDPELLDQPGVS